MNKLTSPKGWYRLLFPAALLIAGLILLLDTQIKLGVAIGALYVIPVLMVSVLENRKLSVWLAVGCTAVTLLKLVFWPMGEAIPWMVFANRAISVFIVWVTTLLGLRIIEMNQRMHGMKSLLTVCAWTKRVKVDGRWIPLDRYMSDYLGIPITHGISEEAARKLLEDLQIEVGEGEPHAHAAK